MFVLRVPQVGHLAPHAGFVFELAGFVEPVDVLLDVCGELCSLVLIGRFGAEGGEEELDTFGSYRCDIRGCR